MPKGVWCWSGVEHHTGEGNWHKGCVGLGGTVGGGIDRIRYCVAGSLGTY